MPSLTWAAANSNARGKYPTVLAKVWACSRSVSVNSLFKQEVNNSNDCAGVITFKSKRIAPLTGASLVVTKT